MNVNSNYAKSITMDLENLQKRYSNTLIKYRQASTDYINYLNSTSNHPCYKYKLDQKGIDNKCLNYIWSKTGCTNEKFLEEIPEIKNMTLSDIFIQTFMVSVIQHPEARKLCYDKSTNYSTAKRPNFDIITPPLVSVQNASYLGSGSARPIIRTSHADECRVECANNSKCTGATFVSGRCNLRTGDSAVVPTKNSIAIISREKQLLMNMDKLNSELISINNEIKKKISTGTPVYKDFDNANKIKSEELSKHYSALNKERNNIKNLLDKYDKIESGQDENIIRLNHNYYTYFLLFIVAGFLLFLLIKISYSGTQSIGNTYYIIFILIVILIIINYANR